MSGLQLIAYTNCAHSPSVEDAWKLSRHHQNEGFADLEYWTSLARLLERGGFAGLFFADAWQVTRKYGGSIRPTVRRGHQVPEHDPLPLLAALAGATDHLGLVATASTMFYPPYMLAKKLSTIDHLTDGRLGWNVVTSSGEMEFANMGTEYVEHDLRYDVTEEYMEVCYRLWEDSWEDGAIVEDEGTDTYADPEKVHEIDYEGEHYRVPGAHLAAPSPQRTPFLFQAGQSDRGRDFAAKHAEATFVHAFDADQLRRTADDIRDRAESFGRDRDDVKVFTDVAPYVAETGEEARIQFDRVRDAVDVETGLIRLSNHLNHDYSQYDPDSRLADIPVNGIRGTLEAYVESDREWTIREAAIQYAFGGEPEFTGTPGEVADSIERWHEAGADGFLVMGHFVPGIFQDVADYLVPELRRRGLVRPANGGEGTLRERMMGGGPALPESHPAKRTGG